MRLRSSKGKAEILGDSNHGIHHLAQSCFTMGPKMITILTETITSEKLKIPGFRVFSLLDYKSESERTSLGFDYFVVSVTCFCGMCLQNMIVTKANAKESLGKFICLSITEAKAKTNPQIFICNRFCVGDYMGIRLCNLHAHKKQRREHLQETKGTHKSCPGMNSPIAHTHTSKRQVNHF